MSNVYYLLLLQQIKIFAIYNKSIVSRSIIDTNNIALITILIEFSIILLSISLVDIEISKTISNLKKIRVNTFELFTIRIRLTICRTNNQNQRRITLKFEIDKKKQ